MRGKNVPEYSYQSASSQTLLRPPENHEAMARWLSVNFKGDPCLDDGCLPPVLEMPDQNDPMEDQSTDAC